MLNTGDFGEWKVQGKVGGYSKFVAPSGTLGILFLTFGPASRTKSEVFLTKVVCTASGWAGIFQDMTLRHGKREIFPKVFPTLLQELDFS